MSERTKLRLRAGILIGFVIVCPLLATPEAGELWDSFFARIEPIRSRILREGGGEPLRLQADTGNEIPIAQSRGHDEKSSAATLGYAQADSAKGTAEQAIYVADAEGKTPGAPNNAVAPASFAAPDSKRATPSGEALDSHAERIQQRLKSLGAQYLLLETDGSVPPEYRFHCRMLIPNSVYSRAFEGISPDPAAAMEQVLREVEAWKSHSDRANEKGNLPVPPAATSSEEKTGSLGSPLGKTTSAPSRPN